MSMFGGFGAGAGAGAGTATMAATNAMELFAARMRTVQHAIPPAVTIPSNTKGAPAKRRRGGSIGGSDSEDDAASPASDDIVACPKQMEPDDFEKLRSLVEKHRTDPMLRLLPMPTVAYDVLGIPRPEVASAMDAAINCFLKTSTQHYTAELEVRDLSKTMTPEDFPTFYEGPSHPHMLPDGGVRVINHALEAREAAGDAASASATAREALADMDMRGAGAGAGSRMEY